MNAAQAAHCAPAGRCRKRLWSGANRLVPNSEEAESSMVIMSLSLHFGVLRTRELRELLEDEDKINHIVRCSEKFQRLQRATERMLLSNQHLAKDNLSQKPKFRDAKLLLAMKYKELEKHRSIIQAKQEQLAEKYSVHYAQWCLLKKINHAEEECELLLQRFVEGRTPLAEFLDSFLSSRKRHHIRLVLVKRLQERTELKPPERLVGVHPQQHFSVGFHQQVHNPCLPFCSLTAAVVLPACCHPLTPIPVLPPPPFLLPFGPLTPQHSSLCLDTDVSLRPGKFPKWPTRPVRLQPLRVEHRTHQPAPP